MCSYLQHCVSVGVSALSSNSIMQVVPFLCRDDSGTGSGTDPQERRRSGTGGGFTETNKEQGPNYKGKGQ